MRAEKLKNRCSQSKKKNQQHKKTPKQTFLNFRLKMENLF